jgi:hypothetical protein
MKNEEIVRQNLLTKLTEVYGFPKKLIGVEKEISTLLHLQGKKVPKRRYDIICFAANLDVNYALSPLLLIECKAVELTKDTLDQVLGYNYYVNAPFVAIANEEKLILWESLTNKVTYGLKSCEELKRIQADRRDKSLSCI